MSLRSPNFRLDKRGLIPDHDRVLAPVPLRRGQPVPGYAGMTARIDGTLSASSWSCMCGGSPNAPAYGIKWPENAAIDPTRAYLAEANCTGAPSHCTDPQALTYNPVAAAEGAGGGAAGQQLACVYRNALARDSCTDARTPATGCYQYPNVYSQ